MKKLFLASEAKHPDSMQKLENFVGGFKGKKIAYIPTAANGENAYGCWRTESATWQLVNTLGAEVEAVVLEDYKDERVIEILKNRDILWFAGGACGYLMYWVRRSKLDLHIHELLESGSVYVGSSAGSMVCSRTLEIAEVYPNESEPGARLLPGFGFVDFEIFPHYEDELLPKIKQLWKGGDLYLLKNGEAITVVGDKVEILGIKRVLRSGEIIT